MKQGRMFASLLLVLTLCLSFAVQPLVYAAELSAAEENVAESAEVSADEETADPSDPDFWDEFREEFADDAEYLQWYEHYQNKKEDCGIAVAASGGDPFTGLTYDHGAKKNSTITRGVDVSYYNGDIDWAKVKKAGVSYAIIRCGRTGYGSSFSMGADSKYKEYIDGAYSAGIPVGIYYFSQAQTEDEAQQEADYTVKLLKDYKNKISLPVFIDVERGTYKSNDTKKEYRINSVSKSQGTTNIKKYCSIVSKAGYQVGVYGNSYDLTHICDYTKLTAYPLWYAHYATSPEFDGDYDYWQYTSGGKVSGISNDTDCNFFYGTPATSEPPSVDSEEPSEPVLTPTPDPEPAPDPEPEPAPAPTPTVTKPGVVSGLKKNSCTTSSITMSWDALPGATKYKVYCCPLRGGTYESIGTTTGTSLKYTGLKTNYAYYFKVKACNEAGWGPLSEITGAQTAKGSQRSLYTTSRVNLRAYIGTEYEKLTTVPKNTVLNVKSERLGTDGNSWFEVAYTDSEGISYTGYLCGEYVKIGSRARPTEKVKLRTSASSSSDAKVSIKAGKKLIILSSKTASNGKKWFKVYYKTGSSIYTGYLLASTVEKY